MHVSSALRFARSRTLWGTGSASIVIGSLTLASCASSPPVAYRQLSSAALLKPVPDSEQPYQYRSGAADFQAYSKLVIDPVTIYGGPDAQFGSVSQEDRQTVADYMQEKFTQTLGEKYSIVGAPEPQALRLHLTLTGLETSTPVLSTVSHVTPVGIVANGLREATGANGTFFGSVSYAVELSDASTGRLLYAYVSRESPDALDVTASIGELDAAEAGVRIGARHLRDDLPATVPAKVASQS